MIRKEEINRELVEEALRWSDNVQMVYRSGCECTELTRESAVFGVNVVETSDSITRAKELLTVKLHCIRH
jgi:hypothetical protein